VPSNPVNLPARLYDWSAPLEREALQTALELADVRFGERLLDVATGTGALLRELARRDVRPIRALGIDRSRAMLSRAASLLGSSTLVEADARALPFPDGSFDLVTVCYLLHLLAVEDRQRVLQEVHRVARPAGRVVAITVDTPRRELRRVLCVLPAWTGLHRIDLGPELEAAGLHVVRTQYAATGWRTAHPAPRPRAWPG
jgi:ubiquinone/menaquinone biosynthesis C-methylase UbiE